MQCRSRKRLDFNATTAGRKPFKGSVFYLDLNEHPKHAKTLEEELTILGATVSSFLSKDANITYVVTTQKDGNSKLTDIANTTASPLLGNRSLCSPATPGDSPSPLSCEVSGAPSTAYKTRAQKILQKATHGAKHSTSTRKDVVATVKDWGGVKVVSLERVLRAVEKHRSLISSGTAAGSHSRLVTQRKPDSKTGEPQVQRLQSPYIKVEDISGQYRPLSLELTVWPKPDFSSTSCVCPFEAADPGPYGVPIEQSNRIRLKLSDGKKTRSSEKTGKRETTGGPQKASKNDATASHTAESKKPAEVAGGWKRKGYCECCGVKYECLNTHLTSSQHIKFAADDGNYRSLDCLILSAGCSLDSYLETLPTSTQGSPSAAILTAESPAKVERGNIVAEIKTPTFTAADPVVAPRRSQRECLLKGISSVITDLDRSVPAATPADVTCITAPTTADEPQQSCADHNDMSSLRNLQSPDTDMKQDEISIPSAALCSDHGVLPGHVSSLIDACASLPADNANVDISAELPESVPAVDDTCSATETVTISVETTEVAMQAIAVSPEISVPSSHQLSLQSPPLIGNDDCVRLLPGSRDNSPAPARRRHGNARPTWSHSLDSDVTTPPPPLPKESPPPTPPLPCDSPVKKPDRPLRRARAARSSSRGGSSGHRTSDIETKPAPPPLPKEDPPEPPPLPAGEPPPPPVPPRKCRKKTIGDGGQSTDDVVLSPMKACASPPLASSPVSSHTAPTTPSRSHLRRHCFSNYARPENQSPEARSKSAVITGRTLDLAIVDGQSPINIVFSPASRKRPRKQLRQCSPSSASGRLLKMSSPKSHMGLNLGDFTSSPGMIDPDAFSRAFAHLAESSSSESEAPSTPVKKRLRKPKPRVLPQSRCTAAQARPPSVPPRRRRKSPSPNLQVFTFTDL